MLFLGVEVRVTPTRTEIIIMATRTQNVLGEKGRRIRELTAVVQKRFSFPEGSVELYAEKVAIRGLCAIAQAESLRYKLIGGLAVRRYVNSITDLAHFKLSFLCVPFWTDWTVRPNPEGRIVIKPEGRIFNHKAEMINDFSYEEHVQFPKLKNMFNYVGVVSNK